jgi:hypothetical protein
MKITDDQLRSIGRAIRAAWENTDPVSDVSVAHWNMGRAAIATGAPILLAEPTREETSAAYRIKNDAFISMHDFTAFFFAARLRSLTEQPDRAVEAVLALKTTDRVYAMERQMAEKIVAAVRAADREAQ